MIDNTQWSKCREKLRYIKSLHVLFIILEFQVRFGEILNGEIENITL